ncbi:MAG: helix-turn-helix transcriptional regulator [Dinghuibacter sp.]|nr:helix-turn-helix transcriptional regulator [Dinghuibacter sp.]
MYSIKEIRKIMGLSQQQMAIYLGVTRTHFSMAETRRRELPAAALIKMAALQNILQKSKPGTPKLHQPQKEKDWATLQQYANKCRREAKLAQKKLEQVQLRYQNCVHTLLAVEVLQNRLPNGKQAKKDELWLAALHAQTQQQMARCSMGKQVLLTLKAQLLLQMATRAEAARGEF